MGLEVNVQIRSGSNIGGKYPFIVVCFDNDLSNEVYKTASSPGGSQVIWNDAFTVDLKTQFKRILTDGKKDPAYMTFFIFDRGVQGSPSLGSAGVRISLLRETGRVEGDFPVVNGQGTLNLSVEGEKTRFDWVYSDKAKFAAGAVGIGAVAAGLTAVALNQRKKKNSSHDKEGDPDRGSQDGVERKKKKSFGLSKIPGLRALTGDDHSSESEGEVDNRRYRRPDEHYGPRPDPRDSANYMAHTSSRDIRPRGGERRDVVAREPASRVNKPRDLGQHDVPRRVDYVPIPSPYRAPQPQLAPHERPWWEVPSDEDDGAQGYLRESRPTRPPRPAFDNGRQHEADNYDSGNYDNRPDEGAGSVHIHYHENANNNRGDSQDEGSRDNDEGETVYQPRVRVQEPNPNSEYVDERLVTETPGDINRSARAVQNNPYV